jgi:hypothetical protein
MPPSHATGHHGGQATPRHERDLRHKLDRSRQEFEAKMLLVETLLQSADLGINHNRARALERAMGELALASMRQVRALAALGDFLIDGTQHQ